MFGQNEIVGQKFFREQPEKGKMLVTSIFLTLQGEGPFMGRPAVFVRLAKCNLACSFCDTYFESGDWMWPGDIVTRVHDEISLKWGDHPLRVGIVITGGEPTLQPPLGDLTQMLASQGFAFIQIETNGILPVRDIAMSTCIVVSPKCAEAHGTKRPLGYITPHEQTLEQANCLKFVLTADEGSVYHKVPGWAHDWARRTRRYIYISPMNIYKRMPAKAMELKSGTLPGIEQRNAAEVISFWEEDLLNRTQNEANHKWAAEYALMHGYFLSLQMHLYAGIA